MDQEEEDEEEGTPPVVDDLFHGSREQVRIYVLQCLYICLYYVGRCSSQHAHGSNPRVPRCAEGGMQKPSLQGDQKKPERHLTLQEIRQILGAGRCDSAAAPTEFRDLECRSYQVLEWSIIRNINLLLRPSG
jgi:hypothetical protein